MTSVLTPGSVSQITVPNSRAVLRSSEFALPGVLAPLLHCPTVQVKEQPEALHLGEMGGRGAPGFVAWALVSPQGARETQVWRRQSAWVEYHPATSA